MTTSHRPTFETRKGRDLQPTSIVHSRSIAAHKQLKYRKVNNNTTGINQDDAKEKFNELKKDLIQREKLHYGDKQGDHGEPLRIKDQDQEETFEERRRRVASEIKDLDDSSEEEEEEEDSDDSEEDGSDSDSDDDEAELLKELEQIKKERAKAAEDEELRKRELEVMNSNPLINITPIEGGNKIRKNWRQDKVFNFKNNQEKSKTDDDYVNDLLRSDFHQKFLNKYVK
ncbi:Midasin [Wickerhamomyces ciferrii]|uniref:Pre-mRNA-splicing factor CWC15 n=1 Tax=Wickerhamomyces ciferrii (strain ATCC 14091 / BCRC 22168 / CBS 111 / JCM 3599 / NBRC 0793 / NRRL Y-1031 F-60-10) TaxID=1206466 RepID=K0K9V3_WICCF|nr:Midasin [Wickerhamomyces ciferrii]CCH41710.1 Midasin [Wickerhamomyces ciferrii]